MPTQFFLEVDAVLINDLRHDAAPVFQALERLGLRLQAILVTHHHADHVGGVAALRQATGATVYGPAFETIPEPATRVEGGECLQLLGLDEVAGAGPEPPAD